MRNVCNWRIPAINAAGGSSQNRLPHLVNMAGEHRF
ncbi:hypothetical protein GGI59_006586, partial [Rhizobium lentis]|nr:hypothetical protein [Rhizobium lentis]MBB5554233.1 hypothetical protein [Rhizobium lentis]MBB5564868.1 hypothetical protein [Rhizobium lentis]MBB5571382.1 hypothetical protein [Rhizobium lentis]